MIFTFAKQVDEARSTSSGSSQLTTSFTETEYESKIEKFCSKVSSLNWEKDLCNYFNFKKKYLNITSEQFETSLVRDWAFSTTVIGENLEGPPFDTNDASKMFDYFTIFRGGVSCGGATSFLKRVYEEIGWPAISYDMGIANKVTHVVTLVKTSDNKILVQDSTFNVTFYGPSIKLPYDFKDLFSAIKKQDFDFIFPISDIALSKKCDYLNLGENCYLGPTLKVYSLNNSLNLIEKELKHKLGFVYINPLQLFLFPYQWSESEIDKEFQSEIYEIVRHLGFIKLEFPLE